MTGLVGAILCGGRSTRLPNKALLPYQHPITGTVRPLIFSSMDFLTASGVQSIVLLDNQADQILAPVLVASYPGRQFHRCADSHEGIPRALAKMAGFFDSETMFVIVCCDNLYMPEPLNVTCERAVVREVPADDAVHLSKWHQPSSAAPGRWITRNESSTSRLALSSPWFLKGRTLIGGKDLKDIVDILNEFSIPPWNRPSRTWKDLGTEDTFLRYWADIHAKNEEERNKRGRGSAVELLQKSAPELRAE